MHPVERDDLKRFIMPYLALDAEEEAWDGGYFKVKEGPSFRDAKDRVASIRWEQKGGNPRDVRDVLQELEEAVDLITGEAHDRVWVVAHHKGANNPSSWVVVAQADGMGEGHHSSEMERALTTRMARGAGAGQGNGDITAIALARMGMGAQAQLQEMSEKYVAAVEQLAVTAAENSNLRMLLEGALSLGGADRSERMFELLQAFAPHLGPVAGQALGALLAAHGYGPPPAVPGAAAPPTDPGSRIDHHIAAIRAAMEGLVLAIQSNPGAVTPAHRAAIAQLIATVLQWQEATSA